MNSNLEYTTSDYLNAFRRRRGVLLAVALPILLSAGMLAAFLPDKYTSSAEIDINLEGASANTLEPIEVSAYADQYIAKLTDRVMKHENLVSMANDPDLVAAMPAELSEGERIDLIRSTVDFSVMTQVVLSPITGREVDVISGVRVSASGDTPEVVFLVAQNSVRLFLDADRESRTERASSAFQFLNDQMSSTEQEILTLEKEIAEFKVKNACCLPELVALNTSVIERTERDIESVQPRVRALEQDRAFLQRQLDEIRQLVGETDRLEELEEEYTTLVANYGPNHPDVVRLRRQIAAITSAQEGDTDLYKAVELRMELVEAEQKYSSEHPDVIRLKQQLAALEAKRSRAGVAENSALLQNPRYIQVRAELNAIESELTELRTSEPELRDKIREYEARLRKTPQVESEFQALNRRLESLRGTYDDLQRRAVAARQSEALESTDIAARLEQVKAPGFPRTPSGPPRTAILILGIFMAGTLGFGSMLFAEMTDGTIRDSKDVIRTLNMVPLATIPVIENAESKRRQRWRLLVVRGSAAIAVVALVFLYFKGIA